MPKKPTRVSTILHPISKSLALCTLLYGCTLPPPLDAISLAKSAIDIMLMANDKPTTTDIILTKATRKKCRTTNIIKNKSVCTEDIKNDGPKQEINNNNIILFIKKSPKGGNPGGPWISYNEDRTVDEKNSGTFKDGVKVE